MPSKDPGYVLLCCIMVLPVSAGCAGVNRQSATTGSSAESPSTEDLMQQIRAQYPAPELYVVPEI